MLLPRIPRSRTPPRPPEPVSLWVFLLALVVLSLPAVTRAQTTSIPSLPLQPTTYDLSLLASQSLVLSLAPPSSSQDVYISHSLCTNSTPPLVVLTTSADIDVPSSATDLKSNGGSNPKASVWRVDWDQGFASWNGTVDEGGLRVALESAEDGIDGQVEISMAQTAPLRTVSTHLPVLGDTTSQHVLLFTPVFASAPAEPAAQTYPDYKVPPPLINYTAPATTPNHTLYIFPSSVDDATDDALARSSCAVRRRTGRVNATVVDREIRLLKQKGWREMLVLDGLESGKNYTMWTERTDGVNGTVELSGPMWFQMKQADFPCPLAYSLTPLCPSIAYAAALPQTTSGLLTSALFPANLTSTLEGYLSSFAATLQTYACGRDTYSPVSSCEMCYEAYREWVCRMVVPRCADPSLDSTTTQSTSLIPASPLVPYTYTQLLPCLETCQFVDRICPVFLGFRCPLSHGGRDGLGTARETYGVGMVEWEGEVGEAGGREVKGVVRGCELWEGLRG